MNELILSHRYTSSTANAAQNTPENSIGGFPGTNTIYTATTATSRVSKTVALIPVTVLPTATEGLAQIEFEITKYTATDTSNSQLTGVSRGRVPNSSPQGFSHGTTPYNPVIRYLTVTNLFNPKFDGAYTQYRCIAIRNISSLVVEDVKVILIEDRLSDIDIDLGIEVPDHDYRTGIITSTPSNVIIVDSSLAALFVDNYFAGSLLRMTSGAGTGNAATISSYTGASGTFVLSSTLGTVAGGDTFEIECAPSQIVTNQLTKPNSNGNLFFGFLSEGGSDELGYNGIRENADILRENDVFYLWIQRTLARNARSKDDTGTVIFFSYILSGS